MTICIAIYGAYQATGLSFHIKQGVGRLSAFQGRKHVQEKLHGMIWAGGMMFAMLV